MKTSGKLDAGQIMNDVIANRARLKNCERHTFDTKDYRLGQKVMCIYCGGKLAAVEALSYVDGYKAAGGNPGDVWPDKERNS